MVTWSNPPNGMVLAPTLLQRSPGYSLCLMTPSGCLVFPDSAGSPPGTNHCTLSSSSRPMGMQPPSPSVLLVWHKQARMRNIAQPKAFVPSLFAWWIAAWPICSACSHWDFTFDSRICRVSQTACFHQAASGRKDRAPLHNRIFVQHVWGPQPPQADLLKKSPRGKKPF